MATVVRRRTDRCLHQFQYPHDVLDRCLTGTSHDDHTTHSRSVAIEVIRSNIFRCYDVMHVLGVEHVLPLFEKRSSSCDHCAWRQLAR